MSRINHRIRQSICLLALPAVFTGPAKTLVISVPRTTGWTSTGLAITAGDLLEIRAELTRIGTKSITVRYEMTNLANHGKAATMESIYVLFDLQKRKGIAISDGLREKACKHLVEG